ncbi:MAG: MFS transporter [Promethearchaeati archaeon SRVP18_Atabeyarchaeia-1]
MGRGKLTVLIVFSIVWGILTYGLDWFFLDNTMVTTTFATTYTQIGILLAVTAFINAVVMLPSGRLADRFGRKPVVIVSFIGLAICYFAYTFALTFEPLLVLYIVGSVRMIFAATAWVALLAWVADQSSMKNRGTVMSGLQAALTVANIGALGVIGVLYESVGSYMTFVIVAAIQFVAVLPLLLVSQRESASLDSKSTKPEKGGKLRTWREVIRDTPLILLSISAMIATAPGILIQTILIPYLETHYAFTLAGTTIPLMFMLLFTGVGFGISAFVIDKLRVKRALLIASLAISVVPLVLLLLTAYLEFMQNIIALTISLGIFGLGIGASTPTYLAIMADLAPTGEMGTEMGVFQGILNFNYVIGRAMGGYLLDLGGLATSMLGSIALVLISLILVAGVVRKSVFESRKGK